MSLPVYAVWPQNNLRGEVVAFVYGDHWLLFERDKEYRRNDRDIYTSVVTCYELFKDPIKVHGDYRKRPFRKAGTYMERDSYIWDPASRNYVTIPRKDRTNQGRFLAKMDLDNEKRWYEIVLDPLSFVRLASI